jgi:enterochelin esterase-like enzyme
LIPHIDTEYRSNATRENRALSGWSMGGAGAFYFAVKYLVISGFNHILTACIFYDKSFQIQII